MKAERMNREGDVCDLVCTSPQLAADFHAEPQEGRSDPHIACEIEEGLPLGKLCALHGEDEPQSSEPLICHHEDKRPFRAPKRSGLLSQHSISLEQESPVKTNVHVSIIF